MWYAIHARDRAGSLEKRLASRSEHLGRLNELNDQVDIYPFKRVLAL